MDKQLFPELHPLERQQMLRDNADTIEELGYNKEIPDTEMGTMKEQLVTISIDLRDVRADKKEADKEFNKQIKDLKDRRETLTQKLKMRSEYVKEDCFKFIEGDEVGYYNREGLLVYQRPARADERQATIQQALRRTGTNG